MSSSYRSCPSSPYLVFAQQSAAASPGAGIIGATRTRSFTGTRSHANGAVRPPSECATTTRSVRFPIASTTASVYSASPAASSSHGRSGATVSWPRSRRSASTRCQYQPTSPAPWIRTNVRDLLACSSLPSGPRGLYGTTPWRPWTHRFDHASDRCAGPRPRHPVQRRRAFTIQARESNQTPSLLACAASVSRLPAASSPLPTVVEPIEPVMRVGAFGIRLAEALRDGRSDGGLGLLPADIFSSSVQLGAPSQSLDGSRWPLGPDTIPRWS